jgi:hypothetical protein
MLLAVLALPAAGQSGNDNTYTWSGKIPAGRWIHVQNLNGGITVGAASGDNVEVTATKHWRRGDPAFVHFENKKYGPGNESVLICALWGERSACDDQGYHTRGDKSSRNNNNNNNDVSVDFRVLVPKGVKISMSTVNGAVTIDGATSDIDAATINGEVDVATSGGSVNASNVNGGIRARLGRVDPDGNMDMTTVNGSVSVEFDGDFGADVDLQTVSGSLDTNFPMTVSGRLNPRHLRAHIGKPGGPRIKLETVNGSVELKKR